MAEIKSIVLLVSVLLAFSSALHDGAPGDQACESMTPQHGFPPQTENSPFRISLSATASTGEPIDITLMAPSQGPKFRGFFIQVRQAGSNIPVGQFNPNSDPQAKPVTCSNNPNVAMTHKDNKDKDQVKLQWTPPQEDGKFDVFVTFVQQQDTFWVKQMPAEGKITVSSSAGRAGSGTGQSAEPQQPASGMPSNTGNSSGNSSQPPSEAGASTNIPVWGGIGLTAATVMISLFRYAV